MAEAGFHDYVLAARGAVAKGDYATGIDLFNRALSIKPDSADALYGLATVHYLKRDYDQARVRFEQVLELDDRHAGAVINLGALCNIAGKYDDAVTYLRKGITLDRSRAEGFYNLGIAYRKLGRFELAIQAYREAHHLSPRMVEAVYNLGNVYFEMARYDQALSHYRRALEINPGFRKAHDGMLRAETKIKESKRPLDSGIIVTGTRAGDPIESDARLDRVLNPEHDQETLGNFHRETEIAHKSGEILLKCTEDLDTAVRNLAIHLASDAPGELIRDDLREIRIRYGRFRELNTRLKMAMEGLTKLRDKLLEQA